MSKVFLRAFSWVGQFLAPLALGILGYSFVSAAALLLVYYIVSRITLPRRSPKPLINWCVGLLVVLVPGVIFYWLGAGLRQVLL